MSRPRDTAAFCSRIIRDGACENTDCSYDHSVPTCNVCQIIFGDKISYHAHIEGRKHRSKVKGNAVFSCSICNSISSGVIAWKQHKAGKLHRKTAVNKGLDPNIEPEQADNAPGQNFCTLCKILLPDKIWTKHQQSAKHNQKQRYAAFIAAKDEAGRDKNGVMVLGDCDFGIIAPAVASKGASRTMKIVADTPSVSVTLLGCTLRSAKSIRVTTAFTASVSGMSRKVKTGQSIEIGIIARQEHIGRYEDRLDLLFEDVILKTQFFIARPLNFIVGSQSDHSALQPEAPYIPKKRTKREPETEIQEGIAPPALNAIPYRGRLPFFEIPNAISLLLSSRSSEQDKIRDLQEIFIPADFSSSTYTTRWKHLLWVEEFRMEHDLEHYDKPSEKLIQHNQLYYLAVPGLAEKRPSVLIGDRILIRRPNAPMGKWAEGRVHVVRRDEVGLRLFAGFSASSADSFLVRFKLNRLGLRRQHQALVTAFDPDRILFPSNALLPASIPQNPGIKFGNSLIASNQRQVQAIVSILQQDPGSLPFVVFGPPGTGKTVTIVEAINQIIIRRKNSRVLVCTPSNSAADLIAIRLNTLPVEQLFRVIAPSRTKSQVPDSISQFTCQNADGHWSVPSMAKMSSFRVVVSTCGSASILSGIGMKRGHFSHIFIDEAGQATEPEVMTAIKNMSDNSTNIVLSGDPKQLGPIIRSSIAKSLGLGTSFVERLMEREAYDEVRGYGRSVVKLTKNFRSHSAILKFPNQRFYEGELQACGDPAVINSFIRSSHVIKSTFPVVFHSVAGKDDREASSPSFFNIDEASVVKTIIQKLRDDRILKITDEDIGVIAPYHAQCLKIRAILKAFADQVKVGSVEEFQGQERKVIIISTVRSSKEFVEYDLRHTLGFVANPRRFNVAVTRAKALLVVIGDPTVLSLDPLWRSFLNYIYASGGWKGPDPSWDPSADVDPAAQYDRALREAAQADMDEFSRMLQSMTLTESNVEENDEGDVGMDRLWNEME